MYKIEKTKKGLNVISVNQPGANTVTVLVMVGTGSKYETRENNGISHFLEHMFFKGAKRRKNTFSISSSLDAIGADFNAFTAKEYTGYWIKAAPNKTELMFDVLGDMLLYSRFDSKEIARENGVIVEELNMYEDNPMMSAEDVFENCMFGDCPAGWDIVGTKENILSFRRHDFVEYFNSQYCPENTFFCVVGNIGNNQKKIFDKIDQYFGGPEFLRRGKNFHEKNIVNIDQNGFRVKLREKKTDQVHLYLGVPAFDYIHRDRPIVKVLSTILGGSMSSRLFINLRERNGLAYYVGTSEEAYTDCGYVATRAGLQTDNIDKAINIILSEYKKIREKLVTAEELARAKEILRGRVNIQMESTDNVANWYARQAAMLHTIQRSGTNTNTKRKFDALSAPDEYLKEISKVTAADIKRVAQEIFKTEKLNLAMIGPFNDAKRFEKILHSVKLK